MSEDIYWEGTLEEMIDRDIIDCGIGQPNLTDGFSLGKRGKAKFWMWDPTPNGFYKLYEQDERGDIVSLRYVDARKQQVRVFKNQR